MGFNLFGPPHKGQTRQKKKKMNWCEKFGIPPPSSPRRSPVRPKLLPKRTAQVEGPAAVAAQVLLHPVQQKLALRLGDPGPRSARCARMRSRGAREALARRSRERTRADSSGLGELERCEGFFNKILGGGGGGCSLPWAWKGG